MPKPTILTSIDERPEEKNVSAIQSPMTLAEAKYDLTVQKVEASVKERNFDAGNVKVGVKTNPESDEKA